MDSPQSVVSPFRSSVLGEGEKHKSGISSKDIEVNGKEAVMSNMEEFLGVLDVYIHQARDIQNICIYHKQDVYAKICLTSNPKNTVSTKTINGGGRNPVFNENLRLNVLTVDSSLKCEIWMLSRVKNYLEDQLLGFALVPLSEVLIQNGKLEKEFSLSSTDLFHSPAGFVQLSLSYSGDSPDVMAISKMPTEVATNVTVQDSETSESLARDLDKIEFPDPKIVNEDHLMVSEYFGIPCEETQCSDSLATSDAENHSSEAGVRLVESFSACSVESVQPPKVDSPPSSVSTNGVSSSVPESSESSDAAASKSPGQEQVSVTKEAKNVDVKDGESDSSSGVPSDSFPKPLVTVNIEPEPKVVQQDIVDMYMKSMQQFTESLAKMKLPMDIESEPTSSGNSTTEQKLQPSKNSNSRVFYGSRAFF
ncbi:C2 domain [Sesbania bispinosa]|nr:C2 domain [Sesbania bispinosa]